jgi:hypothetical protein
MFERHFYHKTECLILRVKHGSKSQQDRQCMYNVTLRRVRAIIVAVQNQRVSYSEGLFCALGIQHPMRKRHIAICGLSGSNIFLTIIS